MAERIYWPGWETGAIIGRGSFGEVYEIHRDVFGTREQAALKVITIPQHASDVEEMYSKNYDEESITSAFQGQFESIVQEYTLMHSISDCPNIVRCDDVRYIQHDDSIGWDIYIKMELLTPLVKAIAQNATEETVIRVGMDICRALERCCQAHIIHRDIKPQNILMSAEGVFKLGDFGIAKTAERTMGGTRIGSYDYMAPEVNFFQPYGSTVDTYSLGLVLYWLLNERRGPFLPLPPARIKPEQEREAWNSRMRGEPLPPPAHGSERLKAIVLKACAYHPADRYASATEMLNALQALLPKAPVITEWMDETDVLAEDIWVQQTPAAVPPAEDLDVRQTLQFAYEDNPVGKAIYVQAGAERVQVWIPQQFTNGQTLFYQGMGRKSAYSEKRGDLYLTVHVHPQVMPVQPVPQKKTSDTSKIWMILAAVIVIVLIIAGVWKNSSQGSNSNTSNRDTNTSMQQNNTHEQNNTHVHSWIGATCTKPKTCNTCGATEGTALGHDWKEATYDAPKTCRRCGQTEGSAKEAPLTATVASTRTSNRTKIPCAEIEASSYLKYNSIQCPPNRVLDGRTDTSWQDGVSGWGINEWLRIYFDQSREIRYISGQLGFWATENAYWENGRPARIRLDFSDGSSVECTFPDQMKEYEIRLSKPVQASWVKITILDVYEGTMYEDTCITEISVYS